MHTLLNQMGISIYTEETENIGNYTISVVATLSSYPEKTASFEFGLEIDEELVIEATVVSFAPVLNNDVSEAVQLNAGESWSITLDATDADNDLATIDVTYSGTTADWLIFDQEALTISTIPELAGA